MTAAVHMLPQLVLLIFVLHTSMRCWSQLPMPRLSQIIWKTSLLCLTALRGAAAPERLPVEQNRWRLDASRCATSVAHLPVSVRSAEGKEAKEFPGLGFFNQTVPPSSAGSKRRKSGSSGGPTRRRRRHTASSYDSLRQGRCITALQAKARGQPSERAPHCALNPISSGGTGRRGGRRGKLRRRSARVTGKGGDLTFKIKALAQKGESVSGKKRGQRWLIIIADDYLINTMMFVPLMKKLIIFVFWWIEYYWFIKC